MKGHGEGRNGSKIAIKLKIGLLITKNGKYFSRSNSSALNSVSVQSEDLVVVSHWQFLIIFYTMKSLRYRSL